MCDKEMLENEWNIKEEKFSQEINSLKLQNAQVRMVNDNLKKENGNLYELLKIRKQEIVDLNNKK